MVLAQLVAPHVINVLVARALSAQIVHLDNIFKVVSVYQLVPQESIPMLKIMLLNALLVVANALIVLVQPVIVQVVTLMNI